MATVNETITPNADAPSIPYRQTISPNYLDGSFVINDADDHIFKVDGRGKGRMTVCVDISTSDQTITVTVFGMHVITGAIGDDGVAQIGQFTVTNAQDIGYETINDVFPFYIVRCTPAAAATGSPTCKANVNFAAF